MNTEPADIAYSEQAPNRFRPGQSGNPAGRPPGIVGGRVRALQVLDQISGNEDNVKLLAASFEAAFRKNPLGFFQRVMKDLIPRESLVKIAAATPNIHRWHTLEDAMRESEAQREDLRALRREYPGQDSRILDLIIEERIPIAAIRNQMKRPRLAAP